MAVSTHRDHIVDVNIKNGSKSRTALLYILIGLIAIAVSLPAAIATSDIGIFEECFASVDICTGG